MIKILQCLKQGECHENGSLEGLSAAIANQDLILWIEFQDVSPEIVEPVFRDVFKFHQLAIEDALHEAHGPKLDDWEKYLYVVLHDIVYHENDSASAILPELDIFIGPNYLVTHHHRPVPALDRVWANCQQDRRLLRKGPDHLFFRIAHELVHDHLQVIDKLDEKVNQIEDQVFGKPDISIPEQLFSLKRMILQMRRTVSPQRDVFSRLAREHFVQIDQQDRIFFRDLYEQSKRLYELMENLRDLVSGTLDTYLSMVNNHLNDTMMLLTIITTLGLPLTFLTGFFGMNFFAPATPTREWTSNPVLTGVVVLMVCVPTLMYFWIRRKMGR